MLALGFPHSYMYMYTHTHLTLVPSKLGSSSVSDAGLCVSRDTRLVFVIELEPLCWSVAVCNFDSFPLQSVLSVHCVRSFVIVNKSFS